MLLEQTRLDMADALVKTTPAQLSLLAPFLRAYKTHTHTSPLLWYHLIDQVDLYSAGSARSNTAHGFPHGCERAPA